MELSHRFVSDNFKVDYLIVCASVFVRNENVGTFPYGDAMEDASEHP